MYKFGRKPQFLFSFIIIVTGLGNWVEVGGGKSWRLFMLVLKFPPKTVYFCVDLLALLRLLVQHVTLESVHTCTWMYYHRGVPVACILIVPMPRAVSKVHDA